MKKETCNECFYAVEDGVNKGVYRSCHRYPHVEQVLTDSFCGEFKFKPAKKKAKDGK